MKTLTMYRPNAIQNALSGFDRYFESFFGDSVLSPATGIFAQALAPLAPLTPLATPAVDIRETENSYALDMELPGYDEKDIEISIDGNSLSVSSKHEEIKEEKKDQGKAVSGETAETWLLKERRLNSFSRSFKLPENANPEEVTAEFKKGILSLKIKKRPEAQKRKIQISVN